LRLGERLVADGHEVLALRRTAGPLPSGFRSITQDLRAAPPRDLPSCESVVVSLPPDSEDRADGDVYAAALANLAGGLSSRPSRVIFVSSTRVLEGWQGLARSPNRTRQS